DVVVRGGTVVDGTGGPARTADVALAGGRVVEVGRVDGRGAREVDADGALVTPGFVDIHTHYDGQATWDQRLQPSSGHGVTTVVAGNCGVGFAPVRPGDHDMLVELMEGVEDLPGVVLQEGLPWAWESMEQYLDYVGGRSFDIDLATQMCHAPVRVYVMGQRGADREPATAEEIAAMGDIVAAGIRAGALGFSTSRTLNHRTSRGEPTPTLTAARDELVGIARAVGATGRGVLQVVSDFSADDEGATLLEMMRASGRPLSFSLLQARPGRSYAGQLELLERARAEGLPMRAQVAARAVGVLVGLEGSVNPLARCPSLAAVAGRSPGEQARHFADAGRRAQLVAEAAEVLRPSMLARTFELGSPPDYEPDPADSVATVAARTGVAPAELLVDLLLADEGRALLYMPFLNYADGNLDAAAELLGHEFTVPGLGDGGAHVGTICDGSFPTTLLTYWARDRARGATFDVPFVVARQCRGTAEAVGLLDRGVLAPGYRADVNVIDHQRLSLDAPRVVHDLPAGGKRLLQDAHGYLHTFVAGVETYTDGEPTGALPGRLVRGPQAVAR
ncbi:MAG TPA: amidohydrolase family protein, partial [Acidimicrobiales bacterium]|nr:amidohydrolase family protein [Acidimicrobiales bacterium]